MDLNLGADGKVVKTIKDNSCKGVTVDHQEDFEVTPNSYSIMFAFEQTFGTSDEVEANLQVSAESMASIRSEANWDSGNGDDSYNGTGTNSLASTDEGENMDPPSSDSGALSIGSTIAAAATISALLF
mmetsp:Transcript_683/g.933  ORF Transcript_683/g.933 Transcript_683/m.933 type:complete len:128 (-) Transcript_683:61-444(-)